MGEIVTSLSACAISTDAEVCSDTTGSGINCNDLQSPIWFGLLCRCLWPSKPWLMLMQIVGIKERSAHNAASGVHEPNAGVLRDLLRSPEGYRVLSWLMQDDPPMWWVAIQRERKQAALAKQIYEQLGGGDEVSEPFWMIYGMNQGRPTLRHATFDAAKAEAERLARFNPGIEFFVLQSIACAKKADVEFRRIAPNGSGGVNDDEIPF